MGGSEPYLVCIPLDRVAGVAVGTLPVAGRFLAKACIAITGETATVDIIGLRVSVRKLHEFVHVSQLDSTNEFQRALFTCGQ